MCNLVAQTGSCRRSYEDPAVDKAPSEAYLESLLLSVFRLAQSVGYEVYFARLADTRTTTGLPRDSAMAVPQRTLSAMPRSSG